MGSYCVCVIVWKLLWVVVVRGFVLFGLEQMHKVKIHTLGYYMLRGALLLGVTQQVLELRDIHSPKTILFWGLSVITLIISLAVQIKSPGRVTTNFCHSSPAHSAPSQPITNHSPTSQQKPPVEGYCIIQHPAIEIRDVVPKVVVESRYCRLCQVAQPIRSKHCHDCGVCVLTFDHHCYLLETCIGEKNRPLFYLFLVSELAQSVFSLSLLTTKMRVFQVDVCLLLVLTGTSIVLCLSLLMLVFHSYLMVKGITTWEYFSWPYISYLAGVDRHRSPFSTGVLSNLREYWSLWCYSTPRQWELMST